MKSSEFESVKEAKAVVRKQLTFYREMTQRKKDMSTFMKQFSAAQDEVRKSAETMPQMFPQWHVWQNAEAALEEAKIKRDVAKLAWDKFRGHKS